MLTATANGKKFTFPQGTTPEQMGAAIDEYFSNSSQPQSEPQQAPETQTGVTDRQRARSLGRGSQPQEQTDSLALQFGQGASDTIASLAGLPVDVMESILNLGVDGINAAVGSSIPRLENSAGGSNDLRNNQSVNSAIGAVNNSTGAEIPELERVSEPQTTAGKVANIAGQIVPAIATGGAAISRLPAAQTGGAKFVQTSLTGAAEGNILSQEETPQGVLLDTAFGAAFAGGGQLAVDGVKQGAKLATRNKRIREELINIASNAPDSSLANNIKSAEEILSNGGTQKFKTAVSQGFDDSTTALALSASQADKDIIKKGIDIIEQTGKNRRAKSLLRPTDAVGDEIVNRFNIVRNANKEAGKSIDAAAKELAGQKVDIQEPFGLFLDDLDNLGVTAGRNSKGKLIPDFEGSSLDGLTEAESVVKRVLNQAGNQTGDARQLHMLKRFIDNNVSYGSSTGGLVGDAEQAVKRLRANIDEVLDTNFPSYNEANTRYAETIGVLKDFESKVGKFKLTDEGLSKKVGTLSRRVLSNAQSRVEVLETLENLSSQAVKQGGKVNGDLVTQISILDDIESVLGSNASTSLRGEVSKAFEDVAGSRGTTLTGLAVDGARAIKNKVSGVNDDNKLKAIRALLE